MLLVGACHFVMPMELQTPLLFNYTFAVCQPEDLIENLKQQMESAYNFDTTGKLFEKLIYERFSLQDLAYLIEVISSPSGKISYNTASYSSVYKQESFLYSSVAMILKKEGLLGQKNITLQNAVQKDEKKYLCREKNMPLYLNPFCRDRELASRFYYKLIENRVHMKKRNTLYLDRNKVQHAVSDDLFDSDDDKGESLTSKLLKELDVKLIERGIFKDNSICKVLDFIQPQAMDILCSSPIPQSFDKIIIDDSISLDDVDAIILNSPGLHYSNDIKKLNDKLIEIDNWNRLEKDLLVQRFIEKLESNKSLPLSAPVHVSVRFDESVVDPAPTQKARRSRRGKK
jgi:hypothetical protein